MRIVFACGSVWLYDRFLRSVKEGIHALLSQVYLNQTKDLETLAKATNIKSLIIDSGAFTAWTSGKQVDFEAYIRLCKHIQHLMPYECHFVNLDVIPGRFGVKPTAEERKQSALLGWKNFERMSAEGLSTIHVFHMYEDFSILKQLKKESDYIGISPANDASMKARISWLKDVFRVIQADVKTHAFGFTSFSALSQFPFFSADSSSWCSGCRFGTTQIFDPRTLKSSIVHPKDKRKVMDSSHVFDMRHLCTSGSTEGRDNRVALTVASILKQQEALTHLWRLRGIDYANKPYFNPMH